jgi:glycosyltransferase involved in cell wall biosynthesis
VSDERSLKRLKSWGLDNCYLVRPGIDKSRFTFSPLPLHSEIRLMVGSAPWAQTQFRTKGVDALLSAAKQSSNLQLVLDVNEVLANVHASITLAASPAIVRSYPHSLMDSLAAGKPILVSRALPMSDYVEQTGCGKVVESVTPESILTAAEALAHQYEDLQQTAQQVGQRDFSQQAMIASFQRVYDYVLGLTN